MKKGCRHEIGTKVRKNMLTRRDQQMVKTKMQSQMVKTKMQSTKCLPAIK